jgi:hypothetical protein
VVAIDATPMNAQYQWRPADTRRPRMRRGPVQALTVAPHVTATVHAGGSVSGHVDPPRRGGRIRFYASDGRGGDEERWTSVGTAVVRRSGAYRHRPLRGGVEYIALLPPNAGYAVGVSSRFR